MAIAVEPTPQTRIRAYKRAFPGMKPAEIKAALKANFGIKVATADIRAALGVKDRRPFKSVALGGGLQ